MRSLAVAAPFALLWALAQGAEEPDANAEPLVVTFLANEGFLLSVDGTDVLIDAFLADPYGGYSALPEDVRGDLLAQRAPFDGVELALVSHLHGDHFQPEIARAFLEASESTELVSSPRVIEKLALSESSKAAARVEEQLPPTGEIVRFERSGIGVELWRLRHAGREQDSLQNLGHVIDLGGHTIVHIGDAEMDAELFAPYARDEPFDVALVPYWYWMDQRGVDLMDGPLRAHRTIAMHIPPRELLGFVEQMEANYPAITVPKEAGVIATVSHTLSAAEQTQR